MQYIKCNTPSGQYLIPLILVATHRANYYVFDKDEFHQYSQAWEEEKEFIMHDDYEGIDWLLNNTDWEDWVKLAIKDTDEVLVTADDFWTDSDDFKIIHK